ncbi:MAG: HD domain-containing protein [Candidatus Moranbacteria bacterium]|nr:HD domain-containing protein [Candidatus Moranbacteria bacterium]
MERIDDMLDFLRKAEGLKSAIRYGKTTSGRQESAAEHSWRVTLMTFVVADELGLDIDVCRAMKMAAVHDIAEALTGDIDFVRISDGKATKEGKRDVEERAMAELGKTLSGKSGDELCSLWNEYEAGQTEIARYVRAIDKLETLSQLVESGYETYDRPELIPNYADAAVRAFPQLSPMLVSIKTRLRAEFDKAGFKWIETYDL